MTKTTDPLGMVTERFYFGTGSPHEGRLQKRVVDSTNLALTVEFDYDQYGNLSEIKDPRGNITSYSSNAMRELVGISAPLSVGANFVRDANGNVVESFVDRSDDPLASPIVTGTPIQTTNVYDDWNRLISKTEDVTSSTQRTWTYGYDGLSNLTLTVSPEGRTDKFEFDERNIMWRHTSGVGTPEQSSTQSLVDKNGRPVQLVDGNGHTTILDYDMFDRLTDITDPVGDLIEHDYNKRDEIVERRIVDGGSTIQRAQFVYDELSRMTSTIEVEVGGGTSTLETELYYRADSRLARSKSARNFDTIYAYDTARRLESVTDAIGNVTSFILDPNGNQEKVISTEVIPSSPNEVYTVEYDYDALNRVTEQRIIDRLTPSEKLTTQFNYDLRNNPIRVTDPINRIHTSGFDLANRKSSDTEDSTGISITTAYGYDLDDLLTTLTDAEGSQTISDYDSKRRNTKVTYETSLFESYSFDLGDRLLTHRTQDGVVTGFNYNNDDTLASRSSTSLHEDFTWNALDQLLTADSFDGAIPSSSLSFLYDGFSRLKDETQNGYVVTCGYDDTHNPSSLVYPSGGPTLTRTFDAIERLSTIDYGVLPLATYQYAGPSRIHQRDAGPYSQSFAWDGLRRVTNINTGFGSVHELTYDYDDLNRRTYKQFNHSPMNGGGDVYAYDGGSRLSDVWYDATNPPVTGSAGALNHFEVEQSKVQARTATFLNSVSTTWSSDALHQTTSIGSVIRDYDDKGNLVDNGSGLFFDYDPWNRLTAVSDSNGTIVTYELDALGRRSKRIEASGATTLYVYNGERLLEEYTGTTSTGPFTLDLRYIYGDGLDELIAIEDSVGARFYVYQDALGSIEAITDSTGTVVERYRYDAFGVPTVTDDLGAVTFTNATTGRPESPLGNSLWFTGARWDPESGNYHMRARQYEPETGRFVSRDPIGYVDGPNPYSFGFSNPTNMTDPLGLESNGSLWADIKSFLWNNPVTDAALSFGAEVHDSVNLGTSFITGNSDPVLLSSYSNQVRGRLHAGESANMIAFKEGSMRTASLAFDMVGGRVLKAGGAVAVFALRPIARLAQPLIRSSAGAMGRSAMSAIKNRMIAPAANAARRGAAAIQAQAANLLNKAKKAMPSFGQNPGCSLAKGLENIASGLDDELIEVSRWGRPGLEPGDWIIKGRSNFFNYLRSGKWDPGPWNEFARPSTGFTYLVPKSAISAPVSEGVIGKIKGLLIGQYQYLP